MSEKKDKIFIIDVDKCDGCRECEKACSQGHFNEDGPEHSRIQIEDFEDGNLHVPIFCQACEDSPCIMVCPMNARLKLENDAVVTDEDRCIGCRTCVYICPVGAPVENPETKKLMTCDRCAEKEELLCVKACAEQKALRFVDAKSAARLTARECAVRLKGGYKPVKSEKSDAVKCE